MRDVLALTTAACLAVGLAGATQPGSTDTLARGSVPVFVDVPAGPFLMGAGQDRDPQAFENERWSPSAGEGTVDLPAFFIARTETTVGQFTAFVRATNRPVDARALDAPDGGLRACDEKGRQVDRALPRRG
jgi:formylglycine-generating enzyme required for sulfatase activity